MTDLTPAQRVFGVTAGEGPFELLGLDRATVSPETVREAAAKRQRRLATGNFDPHDVVAAQEAVAAAEAQLADPNVQREWLRLHATTTSRAAVPQQSQPRQPQADELACIPAARAALARAGGWNPRAATHIAAIASAANLNPIALIRAAAQAQPAQRRATRPAPSTSAPAPTKLPAELAPPTIAGPLAAALGALGLTALILLIALIIRTPSAPAASTETEERAAAPLIDPPTEEALDPTIAPDATTTEALVEAMAAAVRLLEDNPADAAWRIEEAVLAFAARWPEATEDERARALALVRAFLSDAAPGGGAATRLVRAVAAPLGESPPQLPQPPSARAQVWSGGAVALLTSDTTLAAQHRDALLAAAARAPEERTFDSGARAALRAVGIELSRSPGAQPAVWDAWAQMLDTLTPGRALARERQAMALGALETLLLSSAPPSRSRASLHAAEVLLPRIDLGGSRAAVARTRFVAWLDDPRVASIDLAILMRASKQPELASRELSPSASADARSLLRDALLGEWGMSAPPSPSERLASDWSEARRAVAQLADDTPVDHLARAVANARLAGAASLAWESEANRAAEVMDGAAQVEPRRPRPERGASPTSDGRWAVEYFSVRRSSDGALDALERAARLGDLGPIDARMLARLALLGSPPPVRVRAQEIASDRADELNLVEALLEQLPRAPRTPRVNELLETITGIALGDPRSDAWMLRARRVLASRLLRLLDPEDAPARFDALSVLLRDAFTGASTSAVNTPADAASAIAGATDALLTHASGLGVTATLDAGEARRRREGRRRVAQGPIQLTVAEALAYAETLAAVAQAERPNQAGVIDVVLNDLELRQRFAESAFAQLDAAFAASADLWGVRLAYPMRVRTTPALSMLPPALLPVAHAFAAAPPANDERLEALDPADPGAYLRLAEEVAYEAQTPDDRALARRLALLAAALAAEDPTTAPTAASACLLLADLSTDGENRAWLRALADSFGAREGLLAWRVERERDFTARLAAAEVLGLDRAEENRRATSRYNDPDVKRVLGEYASAIPGGLESLEHRITHAPSCPECKNERVVRSVSDSSEWTLCHTCRGRPSPVVEGDDLIRSLRLERALLGETDDWSVAFVARGGEPLRDLTLEEAAQRYRVNLGRVIYRNGRWREAD